MIDGVAIQGIMDQVEFNIQWLKGHGNQNDPQHLDRLIQGFVKPYDLSQAPLIRVAVVQLTEKKHVLLLDMHHIITDAVSQEIFVREFGTLLAGATLSPLKLQYKDYAVWENEAKQQESIQKQGRYWLERFNSLPPALALPTDSQKKDITSFEGDYYSFEIDTGETAVLKQIALQENVTLYMLTLAIFNVFLAKISGSKDIVVGSVTAGRNMIDFDNVIGMFVNTLPLRNAPDNEKGFCEFLREVKDNTLNAFENQDYPFEEIVRNVLENRDNHSNPLFDVMFNFQNIDPTQQDILNKGMSGLKIKPYGQGNKIAKFDLSLNCIIVDNKLQMTFEYKTQLFNKERIESFIKYLKEIVAAVISDKQLKLKDINVSHGLYAEKLNIPTADFEF
jgi:hypothetical protein